MNRARTAALLVLLALVVVGLVGLGYGLVTQADGVRLGLEIPSFGGPHRSPRAVARAWTEAVVAGKCDQAASYLPPDATGFMCGSEGSERMTSAKIDKIDVDSDGPLEYLVKMYGEFTLSLEPMSGARDQMNRPHPVQSQVVRLYVEEIDGKYYLSPFSKLLLDLMKPTL